MHAVVGDKAPRRRAIALGVDEAVVVVHARQQCRARLHAIFASDTQLRQRRLKLRTVGLGPRQGIGKRQRNGGRRRLRVDPGLNGWSALRNRCDRGQQLARDERGDLLANRHGSLTSNQNRMPEVTLTQAERGVKAAFSYLCHTLA